MDLSKYQVLDTKNIREAIKKMDDGGIGFMLVVDNSHVVIGLFTDGDFRKAILKGLSLDDSVMKITNKHYTMLEPGFTEASVDDIFRNTVVQHLPVIEKGVLLEIVEKARWKSVV